MIPGGVFPRRFFVAARKHSCRKRRVILFPAAAFRSPRPFCFRKDLSGCAANAYRESYEPEKEIKNMTQEQLSLLRNIITCSRRIVFFGGAGVSTASGIPDFRSSSGLYAGQFAGLSPEMILSKSFFYLHPDIFFDFWRKYMLHPDALPNAAHRFLYELEKRDKLRGIVTQNVDGLHKKAGNIRVYEIHGSVYDNYCTECNASFPPDAVFRSEGVPRCECGGVIRPKVVLYGEPLEKYVCIGAIREITNADTLIVAGTSLSVEPAASFIEHFRGRNLVVINREPVPADEKAVLVIRDDVAEVFGRLCPSG